MPVRYIGRDPYHKGKSLFEICRQLRDLGVGRVVYEKSIASRWPAQKTYYRLSKVIPDMTCTEFMKGIAYGEYVFRGCAVGQREISTGHHLDWILVPKEEEEEFCTVTEKHVVDKDSIPKEIDCPPLLEIVLKQEMKASGQKVPDKIKFPFVAENYIKDLEWRE